MRLRDEKGRFVKAEHRKGKDIAVESEFANRVQQTVQQILHLEGEMEESELITRVQQLLYQQDMAALESLTVELLERKFNLTKSEKVIDRIFISRPCIVEVMEGGKLNIIDYKL